MSDGAGAEGPDCLSLAIAFHQAPGRFPELLHGNAPLPPRIAVLLRLAGGAPLDDEQLAAPPCVSPEDLKEAARFFVDQVLLAHDADHYRVLGVNSDAPIEEIKEHHRLLMRLFHPDRGEQAEEDNGAIAARINLAYNALRMSDRREAYDVERRQAPKAATFPRTPPVRRAPPAQKPFTQRLPPLVARHFPQFVLGGFALLALLAVGLVYVNREPVGAIGAGDAGFDRNTVSETRVAIREEEPIPARPIQPQVQPTPRQQVVAAIPQSDARHRDPDAPIPQRAATDSGKTTLVALATPPPPARSVVAVAAPKPIAAQPAPEPPPRVESLGTTAAAEVTTQPEVPRPAAPQAAPQPAAPQPAPAPPAPSEPLPDPNPVVPREELIDLVAQLSTLYERGDLEGFLALFDEGARIERGGKARIRTDYDDLFRSTDARQLHIWDMNWTPVGEMVRGEGNFQAKVVRKGENSPRIYTGRIRLEAIEGNGTVRLRGMFH